LEQAPYDSWFVRNYSDYKVDSATADQLRSKLGASLNAPSTGRDITFTIFMGTWCGDSKREVPRIFKILDYCGIDSSRVQLVMVSAAEAAYKQSPDHEERGENIFRVPDLIVQNKGKEMGRIVESPVQSLEKDLLQLADGEHYTPHYEGVDLLAKVFREKKTKKIEKRRSPISSLIRRQTSPGSSKN